MPEVVRVLFPLKKESRAADVGLNAGEKKLEYARRLNKSIIGVMADASNDLVVKRKGIYDDQYIKTVLIPSNETRTRTYKQTQTHTRKHVGNKIYQ